MSTNKYLRGMFIEGGNFNVHVSRSRPVNSNEFSMIPHLELLSFQSCDLWFIMGHIADLDNFKTEIKCKNLSFELHLLWLFIFILEDTAPIYAKLIFGLNSTPKELLARSQRAPSGFSVFRQPEPKCGHFPSVLCELLKQPDNAGFGLLTGSSPY